MKLKETIQAAKKIIKGRKQDKKLWSKEDVLYAKMVKRRAKQKLADQNTRQIVSILLY